MKSLYDDEIGYIDRKVGEVLTFLKSTGLDENTLVIITADHGEHFGERHLHGAPVLALRAVGARAADGPLRRPLQGGREERLVQSHNIYPTILELAGLEWKPKPGQTCQSLLEPASGSADRHQRILGCSTLAPWSGSALIYPQVDCSRFARRLHAIQRDNMKLIRPSCRDKPELYDLGR